MRNEQVFSSLPTGTQQGGIPATLRSESGDVLYSFLYNPEAKQYQRSINYGEAEVACSKVVPLQYRGTGGKKLQLNELLLEGGNSRSVRPLLDGIEKLAEAAEGQFAPPVLYFSWGTEIFGPAVLVDEISWTEDSWLSGEPQSARLNIALQQIPPTDAPQEPLQPLPLPETTQTAQTLFDAAQRGINEAPGAILQSSAAKLSDRQQFDGIKLAEKWLKDNSRLLPIAAKQLYSTKKFELAADVVGTVLLKGKKGNYSLPIGKYDGKLFKGAL